MAYKLILKPEVEDDIDEAYTWYEDQKKLPANSFKAFSVCYSIRINQERSYYFRCLPHEP